ncbi:excitatory amino acid transporter 4 isoform X1 [Tachysurus ichikawai]
MQQQLSEAKVRMCKTLLLRNTFVLFTVAAVVVGIMLGFVLRPQNLSLRQIKYFSFPGELLMRMLQMLVLPIIVSSLVTGISSLDRRASGKMGARAIIYYMVTTFIAVFIGIVLVIIIQPGKGNRDRPMSSSGSIESVQAADAFLDLIRNIFPPNLVEASFKQYKTLYKKTVFTKDITVLVNASHDTNATKYSHLGNNSAVLQIIQETVEEMIPVSGSSNGVNALGLVVFSMFFGLVIGNMKQQG